MVDSSKTYIQQNANLQKPMNYNVWQPKLVGISLSNGLNVCTLCKNMHMVNITLLIDKNG